MTYALNTTNTLNGILRAASELETNIVSVERVQEYIELTPEAPAIIPDNRPRASWPERGEIAFEGIEARYRKGLDLILKGINFSVGGGQKIG
jgi:ATP-binding cassette, subfamily C (CFTR/MRP), member 1